MNDTLLQKKIMRRVCWTCYLRRVINPISVKIYAIIAVVIAIVLNVSLQSVIENTAHITNISGLYSFYIAAFVNTEVFVQSLIVGGVVLSLWLLKDIFLPKGHLA